MTYSISHSGVKALFTYISCAAIEDTRTKNITKFNILAQLCYNLSLKVDLI